MFEIFPGIKASINGALHIDKIKAMVIADLHLGFEGILAEKGIYVPKVQFNEIMEMLKGEKKEKLLILLGDIKHEFSETTFHEFSEVKDLFSWASQNFEEVYLVKGNHDNFIAPLCRKFNINIDDYLFIDEFFFIHGHKDIEIPEKAKYVIIGHEHPAVELISGTMKEKVKCFLYGKWEEKRIITLPAFSTLMEGTAMNIIPKEELLSPILKKIEIDKLKCLGIDREAGFLKLPEIGKLK